MHRMRPSAGRAPRGLRACDFDSLVEFMGSSHCKRVAVLSGAGISVAAGIPDFRSPGGMYEPALGYFNPNYAEEA